MMQSKKQISAKKQEGTYGKLLPGASYPGMVNCHHIKLAGWLSWMQPCSASQASTYASELFTRFLLSPSNHGLLMATPIHSQKQPACSPKPEIKVFSAPVKSVNKWYTGLPKVNSTPPRGSSFLLAAMQERNWGPPAPCQLVLGWHRGPSGWVGVSSRSVPPVQALTAVSHWSGHS